MYYLCDLGSTSSIAYNELCLLYEHENQSLLHQEYRIQCVIFLVVEQDYYIYIHYC